MHPERSAIRVVLVRPYGGVNVGAVCRAIRNTAAGELWIVEPSFDPELARRAAAHAGDVLDARRETGSLEEALAGCSLVVGTTARGGAYRSRTRDIRDVAPDIVSAETSGAGTPALVFGPEDSGLTNRDIARCHVLASIPADRAYASLNLAQAALVCLYETFRARSLAGSGAPPFPAESRADAADIEAMYGALQEALLRVGFLSEDNPEHVMMTLRGLFGRAGLDERELRVLRGVARQILWFAEGGYEVARRKREIGRKLR
jgi:tRNA/rRNA methyltransferase